MDRNISSPTFFTSLKGNYVFVVIILDEDQVGKCSFWLIFRKILCKEFLTIVDAVNFTTGMLTNAYGFWLGTVRRIRDRGRGMYLERSGRGSNRELRQDIEVSVDYPGMELVRRFSR
jgi:hypothetical protein